MTKSVRGVIYGKVIQLTEDVGLAEGQEVQVFVEPVPPAAQWGEGLRRCAGALAEEWTEADDRILEELHQERKRDSRLDVPE
jgi:hypothetical protein